MKQWAVSRIGSSGYRLAEAMAAAVWMGHINLYKTIGYDLVARISTKLARILP